MRMNRTGWLKRWFVGFLACALLLIGATTALADSAALSQEEQTLLEAYQTGSLIRLHILAEDDTPAAQTMKLAVRDAILAAFSAQMNGDDADALYRRLQTQVNDMRLVAEETARGMGFEGTVAAEAGVLFLPQKQYGRITLPDGEYRALRITLGKGRGQNWWCVLFPSLCLAVANDQPWRADGKGDESSDHARPASPPAVVWDTEKIMGQWLVWGQTETGGK